MVFDPTKPVENTELDAAEVRDQLNALKALIDAKPSMDDVNAAINENSAANSDSVYYLQLAPSDPPTQSDVQAIIYRLNELITALNRQL